MNNFIYTSGVREKLLMVLLGVTLAVMVLTSGIFYYLAQDVLSDQIYRRLRQTADFASVQIGNKLNSLEKILAQVASRTNMRLSLSKINQGDETEIKGVLKAILVDAKEASDDIVDLVLFGPEGEFIESARHEPVINVLQQSHINVLDNRHPAWIWPGRSNSNFKLGFPLTYEGVDIGKLVAVVDSSVLGTVLENISKQDAMFEILVMLRSEDGEHAPVFINRSVDESELNIQFNPFTSDPFEVIDNKEDYRGKPVVAVLNTINDYPLGIIVKVDQATALMPIKQQRATFMMLIFGSLLLAVFITFIISNLMARPIIELARAASLMASGDFRQRLESNRRDELGILTKSMNQMGEQLLDMRSKLQQWTREQSRYMEMLNERLLNANEELEQLSRTDPLTGLANRREFDLILQREWSRARRNSSWLALCILDVDYFKAYNDTLGHDAGDEALKVVARIIKRYCKRPTDLAVRLGGEEFGILLPDTNAEQAEQLAENIRSALVAENIPHPASGVIHCLTLSAGTYAIVPEDDDTMQTFLEMADRAMYRAKNLGRNRVIRGGVDRF